MNLLTAKVVELENRQDFALNRFNSVDQDIDDLKEASARIEGSLAQILRLLDNEAIGMR